MNKLLIVAGAMVVVAGIGGLVGRDGTFGARRAEGLAACMSPETRNGLRDAILTRVAARGGEVDVGYALTLDTPRLESVDDAGARTVCGGTARMAVPEHRRAALDGVSELSDSVRYVIEPSRSGPGMVVALVGGGDVMMNWLGGPPPPPAPPSADLLRAEYTPPEPDAPALAPTAEAPPADPVAPTPARTVETRPQPQVANRPAPRPAAVPAPAPRVQPPRPASRAPTPVVPPRRAAPTPVIATAPRPAPPVVARARPSFDCGQARNTTERTICSDPVLADMDVAMARRYARMQNNVDEKMAAILRDEQRAWLRRRDACSTRACLVSLYQARTATMGWSG